MTKREASKEWFWVHEGEQYMLDAVGSIPKDARLVTDSQNIAFLWEYVHTARDYVLGVDTRQENYPTMIFFREAENGLWQLWVSFHHIVPYNDAVVYRLNAFDPDSIMEERAESLGYLVRRVKRAKWESGLKPSYRKR